jgi:hypothetical protein
MDALADLLRDAPRRYLLPPLPADAATARAAGVETALAFALEAARRAAAHDAALPPDCADLFTWALGALIRAALAPVGGDAAFQALLLRVQEPAVEDYVRLAARAVADRRAVRTAVDAIAHPGKVQGLPDGAPRETLAQLHADAASGAWLQLAQAIPPLLPQLAQGQERLQALLDEGVLQRLQRGDALRPTDAVQRYLSLCAQHGPAAGSDAAASQGRASARVGAVAERRAVHALREVAGWLDRAEGGTHSVLRGLRTPGGFPAGTRGTKDEWDAAILRGDAAGADVVLLAEVKASPTAAGSDFPRLLRGLQRLALAEADATYPFASADGRVHITGASLRALQPPGQALPPQVIYGCTAPPEANPPVLGAAAKAVLLKEPPCLAYARQLARGAAPSPALLLPLWHALPTAARLRGALLQYESARAARQAMLHPDDLLAAVAGTAPAG